jgi:hypothetical protein
MASTLLPAAPTFAERRDVRTSNNPTGWERRQFTNSHQELSPDAAELAGAIDQYKLQHRRRFINFEEMLAIFKTLGYSR